MYAVTDHAINISNNGKNHHVHYKVSRALSSGRGVYKHPRNITEFGIGFVEGIMKFCTVI
jgi:hypothetical protein